MSITEENIAKLLNLADVCEQQGKDLEMLDYTEKAYSYQRQLYDPTSLATLRGFENLVTKYNVLAMKYLSQENYAVSFDLLKKADQVTSSVGVVGNDAQRLKLRAVTLNNYGCYYKRLGKPLTALSYVDDALKIEVSVGGADSPATTHLNMCAVLSTLGRHQAAMQHAQCALRLLIESGQGALEPSLLPIAYHNLGVEQQALNMLLDAAATFELAYTTAQRNLGDEDPLTQTMLESVENIHMATEKKTRKKKLVKKGTKKKSSTSTKTSARSMKSTEEYLRSITRPPTDLLWDSNTNPTQRINRQTASLDVRSARAVLPASLLPVSTGVVSRHRSRSPPRRDDSFDALPTTSSQYSLSSTSRFRPESAQSVLSRSSLSFRPSSSSTYNPTFGERTSFGGERPSSRMLMQSEAHLEQHQQHYGNGGGSMSGSMGNGLTEEDLELGYPDTNTMGGQDFDHPLVPPPSVYPQPVSFAALSRPTSTPGARPFSASAPRAPPLDMGAMVRPQRRAIRPQSAVYRPTSALSTSSSHPRMTGGPRLESHDEILQNYGVSVQKASPRSILKRPSSAQPVLQQHSSHTSFAQALPSPHESRGVTGSDSRSMQQHELNGNGEHTVRTSLSHLQQQQQQYYQQHQSTSAAVSQPPPFQQRDLVQQVSHQQHRAPVPKSGSVHPTRIPQEYDVRNPPRMHASQEVPLGSTLAQEIAAAKQIEQMSSTAVPPPSASRTMSPEPQYEESDSALDDIAFHVSPMGYPGASSTDVTSDEDDYAMKPVAAEIDTQTEDPLPNLQDEAIEQLQRMQQTQLQQLQEMQRQQMEELQRAQREQLLQAHTSPKGRSVLDTLKMQQQEMMKQFERQMPAASNGNGHGNGSLSIRLDAQQKPVPSLVVSSPKSPTGGSSMGGSPGDFSRSFGSSPDSSVVSPMTPNTWTQMSGRS